ncbi:MAG: aminoacyl-tRNA hydrolase [Acidobacteriia bacterium]|nr:aminoacyl-tRNA hydrolase [Terriglobia bacterium]
MIVLGLGNPGNRYRRTRHNLGFRVLDLLAGRAGAKFAKAGELGDVCLSAEALLSGVEVVLAKPRTYMNRSGTAGAALLEHYAASPCDLLVVHDDADLALGRIRVRAGGSAGGHNGLRSLIATLRTAEFPRVKLGVLGARRAETDLVDYVLESFEDDEADAAEALVGLGADAAEAVLVEGLAAAMNRFNGPTAVAESPGAC